MRRLVMVWVASSGCASEPPLVMAEPAAMSGEAPVAVVSPARVERVEVAPAAPTPAGPLEVEFLGVGGFLLRRGDDAVMTPPLFTRQALADVELGKPLQQDVLGIAARFPHARVASLKAVLVGHAHYDHLLDAAAAQSNADHPVLYGNLTMKNLLAAISPTRPLGCPSAASPRDVLVESERVVALDEPAHSAVDYRLCPAQRPAGAPLEGTWVTVPNSHVRVMAVCSMHPDQFGPIHFAPGSVDDPQCELPARADAWKEGNTLSYLIDFLDPYSGVPTMRVYYQDSPGNHPVGYVPPELLAEKQIDVALLCVGNYDRPTNEPTTTLQTMSPRFAIGGHWEDFFQPFDSPPVGIPFTDVMKWQTLARTALSGADAKSWSRNGGVYSDRALLPTPGDVFTVPAQE